jgi:hypothetical protein
LKDLPVSGKDFELAFSKINCSVSAADSLKQENWNKEFGAD